VGSSPRISASPARASSPRFPTERGLTRSSTSAVSLSSNLVPTASLNSLSFAGSLAGSLTYERRGGRLSEVDPENLQMMSQRKLQANAAALYRLGVQRQDSGEIVASIKAKKLAAEAAALQGELQSSQSTVKAARSTLRSTAHYRPTSSAAQLLTRQQRQEALRETARDSIRREAASRRADLARSACATAARTPYRRTPTRPHLISSDLARAFASCAEQGAAR
jgi:hypothetical protein